jgi:hypothetical protein
LRHDKETERLPSIVTFNQKKRRVEEAGRASLLRSSHFTVETPPICPGSRALTVVVTLGIVTNTTEPCKAIRSSFWKESIAVSSDFDHRKCPNCAGRTMRLTRIEPHNSHRKDGYEWHVYRCAGCANVSRFVFEMSPRQQTASLGQVSPDRQSVGAF